MNRALLLAALGLGLVMSGCREDHPGDIGFFWRFQDAAGNIAGDYSSTNPGCDVAAVTTIRIEIDGEVFDVDCLDPNDVPGATITNFFSGNYQYTIRGYRNSEEIFATAGVVTAHDGHLVEVDTTLAAEGTSSTLPVYYQQNGAWSCSGTPGVAYLLEDLSGNVIDEVPYTNPIACDSNVFGFTVATGYSGDVLPFGDYSFRYLALLNGSGAAVFEVCGRGWTNGVTTLAPDAEATFHHGGFSQTINLPPTPAGYSCIVP